MKSDEIREFCLSLPDSTEKLQWGDALCLKVGGKMFAVLGLDNPRLSFKCTPDVFADLIEREHIRPSPYLGRHKWVMLERLDAVGNQELRELIEQSHQMVGKNASRKKKSAASPKVRKSKKASRKSAKKASAKKTKS